MKNRLKNYGLWVSVIAFGLLICQVLGLDVAPEQYNEVANGLLGLLVLLGIVNNPNTENTGFGDDEEKK